MAAISFNRLWAVTVPGRGDIGQVIESNETFARLAALSKYAVTEEEAKSFACRHGVIAPEDSFEVRPL